MPQSVINQSPIGFSFWTEEAWVSRKCTIMDIKQEPLALAAALLRLHGDSHWGIGDTWSNGWCSAAGRFGAEATGNMGLACDAPTNRIEIEFAVLALLTLASIAVAFTG